MMEKHQYDALRNLSNGLFKNGLVVPAAACITEIELGEAFGVTWVREQLGGRAAANQIHEVLARLETCEALEQLPYPGRPHPRMWRRLDSPFWTFIEAWTKLHAA